MMFLVSRHQIAYEFRGSPRTSMLKRATLCWKRKFDGAKYEVIKLILLTNRTSHTGFRLVTKIGDPEWPWTALLCVITLNALAFKANLLATTCRVDVKLVEVRLILFNQVIKFIATFWSRDQTANDKQEMSTNTHRKKLQHKNVVHSKESSFSNRSYGNTRRDDRGRMLWEALHCQRR